VNEDTPILLENVRFRAEEMLRQKGALILHLSGIIGKDRYPKKWYEMNFVKEGKKILNYVHVDDIVKITDLLFKNFKASERFNLTSGDYKTHRQIADLLGLKIAFANEDGIGDSKRILNKKLLNYLSLPDYQFIKYPEDCM
jgi:nucleoside-diphosphate-sugar epimerase